MITDYIKSKIKIV